MVHQTAVPGVELGPTLLRKAKLSETEEVGELWFAIGLLRKWNCVWCERGEMVNCRVDE